MSILFNPVFRREMCGMRFWRGRFSLGLVITLTLLLFGVLLPFLTNAGAISPTMLPPTLRVGGTVIYLALPLLLAVALKFALDIKWRNGEMDDLKLTLLQPEEIHVGTVWGLVFPVAVGCALLALGAAVAVLITHAPRPVFTTTVILVWWVLMVSNLHFTLVMAVESYNSSENPKWLTVLTAVGFSFLFDLMLFGFLFKPIFLVMNLTDSLTTRRGEWFSRSSGPPPRYRSGWKP